MEDDYQLAVKMDRATTGTFRSTPLDIVMAESKLAPAKPLLDYRQEEFMQRLMAQPKGHRAPGLYYPVGFHCRDRARPV